MAGLTIPSVSALRRAALLGLCLAALTLPTAEADAQTVVSLTFDDGTASQYDAARPQLLARGMLATFYVNSGNIGRGPPYMSWAQVDRLHADRHEIAGHTIDHVLLDPGAVSGSEARRQVCDDAAALRARGYQVLNFAYPYGVGATYPAVRAALQECGFVSARKYGDLRGPDCPGAACPLAETIPPADPYAINSTGAQVGPLTSPRLTVSCRREWRRRGVPFFRSTFRPGLHRQPRDPGGVPRLAEDTRVARDGRQDRALGHGLPRPPTAVVAGFLAAAFLFGG